MAQPSEASSFSSSSAHSKPVVVRVKRKSNQERLDAFWLEINERPAKRKNLDLESLSLSESSGKVVTETKIKKLLVQHVETIHSFGASKDVLQSYLPGIRSTKGQRRKNEERLNTLKQEKKQEQLRSTARQKHEDLIRNARFEQIWKSRRERMKDGDDSLHEICHLYDVVQVGSDDENTTKAQKQKHTSFEDTAILCNYLPLLREYVASAADEIEADIRSYAFNNESMDDDMNVEQSSTTDYVYDLYTVEENTDGTGDQAITASYPLVQVIVEDDFYDGPSDSDYETDDSNAEDNPLNDYPEEESSEGDKDEKDEFDFLEDYDSQYENEVVYVSDEDEQDWRWKPR